VHESVTETVDTKVGAGWSSSSSASSSSP